jgi:hypothetical protein
VKEGEKKMKRRSGRKGVGKKVKVGAARDGKRGEGEGEYHSQGEGRGIIFSSLAGVFINVTIIVFELDLFLQYKTRHNVWGDSDGSGLATFSAICRFRFCTY